MTDIERKLRCHKALRKVYKNMIYYFFVIPWYKLTEMPPNSFIEAWKKQKLIGDKFNEKIDIKLIHIDAHDQMTRTMRMILHKVKKTIVDCTTFCRSPQQYPSNLVEICLLQV